MTSTQPYIYRRQSLVEPDWQRFPGWRDVTGRDWLSLTWQRRNSVRTVRQLQELCGDLLHNDFYADLQSDQELRATMPLLITPQMINTIAPTMVTQKPGGLTDDFYSDPVRKYMMPAFSDRRTDWPSHPKSASDSLHEREMWTTEGLTHRYPTKVLAELVSSCTQYCGHCTRMDLVGTTTASTAKIKFSLSPSRRFTRILDYLRDNKEIRDVVVSGGDVANVPWQQLESFLNALLEIESIRDIRLASKALIGLPQFWMKEDVKSGMERVVRTADLRGVQLAVHTHTNSAQSITPSVANAVRALLNTGVRNVRNQGVILRGVNDSANELLDLCFAMLDGALIVPYYFYMCDMIPSSEHWRVSLAKAQELQEQIMGYLPGFATPRLVCDVPYVGKKWVHQEVKYDRIRGISYWSKNYRTPLELEDEHALSRTFCYYDPIDSLPPEGQQWWRENSN